jgi:hypothetical protein
MHNLRQFNIKYTFDVGAMWFTGFDVKTKFIDISINKQFDQMTRKD